MFNYQFRYVNPAGAVIRTTHMQCETDADALQKARETMKDLYALLEIFEGEQTVYGRAHMRQE